MAIGDNAGKPLTHVKLKSLVGRIQHGVAMPGLPAAVGRCTTDKIADVAQGSPLLIGSVSQASAMPKANIPAAATFSIRRMTACSLVASSSYDD